MRFSKNLLNEIPLEKRDFILNKMSSFEIILLQSKSFADIPKGFWIRRVAGTDIYKFRVNSGDRILFKYEEMDNRDSILFIAYSNHDKQICKAKNYKGSNLIIDLEIDKKDYEEDQLDEKLNEYIQNEVYYKLAEIKKDLVIEDEYISLSIQENDITNMNFLSIEQYKCLSKINNPSIIFGCAGSGKTMVAIRKLIINNDLMINTAYITCSNMILNKTKSMYSKFTDNNKHVCFYNFRDLCKKILGLKKEIVINYEDFYKWMFQNEFLKEEDSRVTVREIWIEINEILKGSICEKNYNSILSKEKYFSYDNSSFDIKTKNFIYKIASMYNHWLRNNKYYDDNDLAAMALENLKDNYKFEYIIYDEIQDLTKRQLSLILSLTNNLNNIMLLGDINQSVNVSKFDLNFMKNIFYKYNLKLEENFMTKNYRNGSKTINWINELKMIKYKKIKSIGQYFMQEEQSIKVGIKPRIFYDFQKEKEFFNRIDEDINSIVIVADESDKIILKEKGYELGRIFCIEDVRGLEYDNIFCYNVLSKFDYALENILSNNYKCDHRYSVYFNLIYIAVTRAKNKLCFIEKGVTKLDESMHNYWNIIKDENIILEEVSKSTEVEQWLKEAIKLEKMEKYYQAAEAYKKAGKILDAKICLEAHERKINYSNTEKFASYILIEAEELSEHLLEKVLSEVKIKYGLCINGYIKIFVEYARVEGRRHLIQYIENNSTIKNISDIIFEALDKEEISKRRVILKVCFYKDGAPINTQSMLKESFADLYITSNNGIVEFTKTYYSKLRIENELDKTFKEHQERKIGFNSDNQALQLRNQIKYESKNADDILDFIFKGKN